jgi:hypothetical protein
VHKILGVGNLNQELRQGVFSILSPAHCEISFLQAGMIIKCRCWMGLSKRIVFQPGLAVDDCGLFDKR